MIDDDRKQGYGISEGGYESGISTVAAPVRGEHERIVAAVSVTVPAQNIDPARAAELIGHVRTAANQLSERLRHLPRVAPLALKQKLAA
jgi:DNA-binding IclR family transcriptional regulator